MPKSRIQLGLVRLHPVLSDRLLGHLYAKADYLGQVDVCVAVTGLKGATSAYLRNQMAFGDTALQYDRPDYRRTAPFSALLLLSDPRAVARELVLPFIRAITQERYDPLASKPLPPQP